MPEKTVRLHIYDLSRGLAREYSQALLGRKIEGVWHTGVVVGDTEYYYGNGIHSTRAGRSPAGTPDRVVELGPTALTQEVADSYLVALSEGRFAATNYDLLRNNCNNFADEFGRFLTGEGVPDDVRNLPDEVLATPYGQTLLSFLANFETAAATHDAEEPSQDRPRGAQPSPETPRRPRCGTFPYDLPMFMMMGGPWAGGRGGYGGFGGFGGVGGCGPCRPRRGSCPHVPTEAPTNVPAEDKPSTSHHAPPASHLDPEEQQADPVAACLSDLVKALRSAGRNDLLDNVLAEHHAVLASMRTADDQEMPQASKKASDDSFEVVQ